MQKPSYQVRFDIHMNIKSKIQKQLIEISEYLEPYPPIYLQWIFEISSLKDQVRQTGFFVYFELLLPV